MIQEKLADIRTFFEKNANPEIVKKYSRYFKDGYNGYGIDQKIFEKQKDVWIESWKNEMSSNDYLALGDLIFKDGKLEEQSLVMYLLNSNNEEFTPETFDHIGTWFNESVDNWATTDVYCMFLFSDMLRNKVIDFKKLQSWADSESQWKRRVVPVTLNELTKDGLQPEDAIEAIEPLMTDDSEYVQKGIGTLMRGLWKKYPKETEAFLMKWKDRCGRLIIQYATEKMDKEYRKQFRRSKGSK